MKKFRQQEPYTKDGKTNFRYTAGKSGCYLIYKNGVLVYVGMSKTDLYKTMYRHFQKWTDPTQIRISYNPNGRNRFTVRAVLCTPAKAEALEKMLILKHRPKDNPNKYPQFKPAPKDVKLYGDFVNTSTEICPF